MKKFLKALSGAALTLTMLVGSAGCNFFKSAPVKEFMNKYVGNIPGLYVHTHVLEKKDAVESTCTEAGTETYYYCTEPGCGKMFSDENGEHRISKPTVKEKKAHVLEKTNAKIATCLETGHEEYYTCSACKKLFADEAGQNEITEPTETGIAAHALLKTDAKAPTNTQAGNLEYYTCSVCKELFLDANATQKTTIADVYLAPTATLEWKSLAGVNNAAAPTYQDGKTTFESLANSAYIENVFVDENGNSLVGAYNEANANTEYTYSMDIKAGGTFHLILFANETSIPVFAASDLTTPPLNFGFYIRFDATDAATNVKLQAVLNNSTPEQGIKAKGNSTFKFDGTTENNVRLVLERYNESTLIIHIWVNGEEIKFVNASTNTTNNKAGFTLRTDWNRNDLYNGIGKQYTTANAESYPTVACGTGLSETGGFSAGLGLAVTGNVVSHAISGEGQAPVTISHLSMTKTAEKAVHSHAGMFVEGKASTCKETGYEGYYTCVCGKLFSDEACKNEIPAPVVTDFAAHTLTKTVVESKDYWVCGVCEKVFADENGENETTIERTLLSIEVATMPNSLTYYAGETFFAEGLVLKAVYAEEYTETITEGYTYTPDGELALTDTAVVVSYQGKTVSIPITVADKSLEKTYTIEAETANLVGIVNSGTNKGKELACYNIVDVAHASGGKMINNMNTAGNVFTWKLHADKAAKAHLVINVAARCIKKNNVVLGQVVQFDDMYTMKINGEVVLVQMLVAPPKGADVATDNGYYELCQVFVDVALKAGDNVISLTVGEAAIAGNLDSLVFTTTAVLENKTEGMKHSLTAVAEKAATCTENGNKAYYRCSACGRLFSDAEGKQKISAPETIPAKHTLTYVKGEDSTCTVAGYEDYYTCVCGKLFSDEEAQNEIATPVVKDLAAHTLTKTEKVEATETQAGCEEYWTCGVCKKLFADAEGKKETTLEELNIPALGHIHKGTYVAATAPTCTEDGNIAYYVCTCGKKFAEEGCINELDDVVIPMAHTVEYRAAMAATAMLDGMAEHWLCKKCDAFFKDEEAAVETTAEALRVSAWKAMAGVSNAEGVKANGSVTFESLANSAYIENVFVDENGNSLVGAYNEANANTEYTYSMDIKAGGTFHLILFANETSIPVFAASDLTTPPLNFGFYIRFDATDAATNVKLQAVLNNSTPEQGIKAKGNSTFKFDGTTENNVRLVLERYNESTLIIHIWVNGEEIKFVNASTNTTNNKAGFTLRTDWNRNDLYNGIGKQYTTANAESYPTVACGTGLSETGGFSAGLGLAVTGNVVSNAISGEGQAPVTISNLKAEKTANKAVHTHTGTLVERKPATCTEDGYERYYKCVCGKLFSDEACEQEIAEPVVIKASHTLTQTVVEGKDYWVCDVCEKVFADANGENETTIERTLLSIEVATMPNIVEYTVGNVFQPKGLTINAIYAENYVETVTEGYTYTPDGELAVTDTAIVVSYQGKTVSVPITVIDPSEVIENTYIFEAENANLSGIVNNGTFKGQALDCYNIVDVAHASGGKMINNMNTAENVISWTINADKAAQATITVYVAARCTRVDGVVIGWDLAFDQMYVMTINGEETVVDAIISPPNGDGNPTDNGYFEICTVTVDIALNAGDNVVALTIAAGAKAGNLDRIDVKTTAVLSDKTDGVKHVPTYLEAKESTCAEAGYDAHYSCKCGRRFSDAAANNEVGDSVLKELTGHALSKVGVGNTEYWICNVCRKTFSDENASTATTVNINGTADESTWNTYTPFDAIVTENGNSVLAAGVVHSGGSIATNRTNSRGVNCVGSLDAAGDYVTFYIQSDKTEIVGLYVEFGNANSNKAHVFKDCYNLIVNGQDYTSNVSMPYSSSTWAPSNKYTCLGFVQLKEGVNEITFKVASGFKYRHNIYGLKFTAETATVSWGSKA